MVGFYETERREEIIVIDELAKRRFERIAGLIASAQVRYEEHMRGINNEAAELERLLRDFIAGLEKINGPTTESTKISNELDAALNIFVDPQVMSALDAANQYFDTAAIELAQLVSALPKTS